MLWDLRRVIFPEPVILNRFAAVLFVFSFGIFLGSRIGLGIQHHDHLPSVQRGRAFHDGDVGYLATEVIQFFAAKLRVRNLASLEHADHADLVALFQELDGVPNEVLEVVLRNSRANLYTLNFLLFFLRLLILLLRQVLIAPKINDLADRRLGGGGDHDKVESLFSGDVESLAALQNSELRSVGSNDPHISKSEHTLVDGGPWIRARVSSISSYLWSPRIV